MVHFLERAHDADSDFAGFVAVERGPREKGLHFQAVMDYKTTSTVAMNAHLRKALKAPADEIVEGPAMVRTLVSYEHVKMRATSSEFGRSLGFANQHAFTSFFSVRGTSFVDVLLKIGRLPFKT